MTVTGSGQFIIQKANFTGEYLSIDSSVKITETADVITAGAFDISNSAASANIATVFKNGWKLGAMTATWTGATSTDWATSTNWDIGLIPGSTNMEDTTVIIPDGLSIYPVTNADYTINSITIGTQANNSHNASLNLATNGITAEKITNYATIKMSGTQTITATKVNGENSTVEYYGSSLSTLAWGNEYENLSFIDGSTASISTALSVSKTTTISNNSSISLTGANVFTNGVILDNAGTVTLNAADEITLKKSESASAITCSALTLQQSAAITAPLTVSNSLTNNSTLSLSSNALSFGSYSGSSDMIKAQSSASITNTGSTSSVISNLELSPSAVFTLNGGNSGLTISNAVYNASSITTKGSVTLATTLGTDTIGALTVNTGNTTLSGNTALSSLSIATGATFSAGSNTTDAYTITIASNWSNAGTFTANNSSVVFSSDATTITGSTDFYKVSGKSISQNASDIAFTGGIEAESYSVNGLNAGSLTIGAESSLGDLLLTGSGGFEFTVTGNLRVTGKIELSGTNENSKLLIHGNEAESEDNAGKIILNSTEQEEGSFICVDYDGIYITDYKASYSSFSNNKVGIRHGWRLTTNFTIISTISPVGMSKIAITFDSALYDTSGNKITSASSLASALYIADKDGNKVYELSNPIIKENTEDSEISDDGEATIIFSISEKITLSDLTNLYVAVENEVTDIIGNKNRILDTSARHCISHYLVNAVEVLRACPTLTYSGSFDSHYSATDFSEEAGKAGYVLLAGERESYSIDINTRVQTGETEFTENLSLFAETGSLSNRKLSYKTDKQTEGKNSSNSLVNFTIDSSIINFAESKSGESVRFMFALSSGENVIDTDGDGEADTPLYAYRLKDEEDITSLDIWSFTLTSINSQRGGVSILNNVINSNKREQTTLEVDVPSDSTLQVYVMTLDGSIVKTLTKSRVKAGKHYYTWNGTNGSGKAVARGMYFIRVLSADIDETRKVMVVK